MSTGQAQSVMGAPSGFVRAIVGVAAFVAIVLGPAWLAAVGWVLLIVTSLIWAFGSNGSSQFDGMKASGLLPARLSLRAFRITLVATSAIVLGFLVTSR